MSYIHLKVPQIVIEDPYDKQELLDILKYEEKHHTTNETNIILPKSTIELTIEKSLYYHGKPITSEKGGHILFTKYKDRIYIPKLLAVNSPARYYKQKYIPPYSLSDLKHLLETYDLVIEFHTHPSEEPTLVTMSPSTNDLLYYADTTYVLSEDIPNILEKLIQAIVTIKSITIYSFIPLTITIGKDEHVYTTTIESLQVIHPAKRSVREALDYISDLTFLYHYQERYSYLKNLHIARINLYRPHRHVKI